MMKKTKILIIRLIIAIILWITAIILENTLKNLEPLYLGIYILGYLIAGYDILFGAVKNIFQGKLLDEFFLMSIASIGAFCMRFFGEPEYLEAVAVMIFFQIGEVFQGIAVEKSRKEILKTIDMKVTSCTLESGEVVDPDDVEVGSIIIVKPFEVVPIDGVCVGNGVINTASLTGEPLDIDVCDNDVILSGSINKDSVLTIRTTKEYYDSTAAKILDMVENATMKKAKSEQFISRFAKIYTPIVVILALLLAIVPPVAIGLFNGFSLSVFKDYIYAALTCLVVSCPCALVVSVPLTYFAGLGANARKKIIVKGGSYLDDLAKANVVVMDKTGTLTQAKFEITKIIGDNQPEIIKIAKGLEKNSTHPLAIAINNYDGELYDFEIKESPGYGVIGYKDNIEYICGSKKLLENHNIKPIEGDYPGSILYIAKANLCIGAIILEDKPKDEAKEVITMLHKMGKRVVVLSGDTISSVSSVCQRLGITEYHAHLLPEDKVRIVNEIIKENDGKVVFVGDGINDAPVLALSDIGVSMGQIGSDAAIEASDVVVINDSLKALPNMMKISKKTKRIVIQNIIFTIGIKVLVLLLCAICNLPIFDFFEVPMGLAIFADVGVCVIAVINAMRALRVK